MSMVSGFLEHPASGRNSTRGGKLGRGGGCGVKMAVKEAGLRSSGALSEAADLPLSGGRYHLVLGWRHRRKKTGGRRRIVIKEDLVAEELFIIIHSFFKVSAFLFSMVARCFHVSHRDELLGCFDGRYFRRHIFTY